jgi:hypothetical protein
MPQAPADVLDGIGDTWKLKAATLQCRSRYPRNDGAAVDGANRRDMLQKHARAVALGPGVQHIISERFA